MINTILAVTILTGVLAPASPGVLEGAQANRVDHCCMINLDQAAPVGFALLAVEDPDLIGATGIAVVEGVGAVPVYVVDYQNPADLECCRLSDRGLAADVNRADLGHRQATIWLRRIQ